MEKSTADATRAADSEGPATKKRGAEKQMRKEEDEDDNVQEEDSGAFQKADDATIAGRRKVTGRRRNQSNIPSTTADKPIAWPTFNFTPEEKKEEPKKEQPKKEEADTQKKETTAPLFSTPSAANTGGTSAFSFSTHFTFNTTSSPATFSIPIPSFPAVPNPSSTGNAIFGENIAKPAAIPSSPTQSPEASPTPSPVKPKLDLPNEPVSTGEEGEQHVFQSRMKVFLLEGTEWKERGVGQLKLNVADDKSYARLIMRAEGALRLVLNVRLFPSMKIEAVGDKAARFIAPVEKNELGTYLVRAAKPEAIKELISAVDTHKHLKTDDAKGTESKESVPEKTSSNGKTKT